MTRSRLYTPALRVFIFGQEVTEDVVSLRFGLNDNRSPSACEVVLANRVRLDYDQPGVGDGLDRYIINQADIQAMVDGLDRLEWPEDKADATSRVAELAERDANATLVSVTKQLRDATKSIPDVVKRAVLAAKVGAFTRVSQPELDETSLRGEKNKVERALRMTGNAYRYPMVCGGCIFHSNDPVRVFVRDPRPGTGNRWYYGFTGFVSDWVDQVTEDNVRTVTIRAEDPLRVLRYARVALNPGISDTRVLAQVEDALGRTFYKDGFQDMSLEDYVYTTFFGTGTTGVTRGTGGADLRGIKAEETLYSVHAPDGAKRRATPEDGIGAFDFSRSLVFYFGPASSDASASVGATDAVSERVRAKTVDLGTRSDALAIYQALVDHEVRASDLVSEDRTLTAEPEIADVVRQIGEHPETYPCDEGRVFLLLPNSLSGGVSRRVLLKDIVDGIDVKTTFTNRLQMLFNVLDRIQFSLWATPRGDICIEAPLFDMEPRDFGEAPVTRTDLTNVLTGQAGYPASALSDTYGPPGGFASEYRFLCGDTVSWQKSFTDEKVRTGYAATYALVQALSAAGDSYSVFLRPEVAVLRALVPQFGVRFEEAEPLLSIATPEGAKLYALLKLNQWNADAHAATVEVLPNYRVVPNRPVEFLDDRMFVGTVRSCDHTLSWEGSGDMAMSVTVNAVRSWSGLKGPDNRPIYEPLGGMSSRPLDYGSLFRTRAPAATATSSATAPAPKRPPPSAKKSGSGGSR